MRVRFLAAAALAALAAAVAVIATPSPASAEQSQQGWTIRRLHDREVTPAITRAAVQILRDHRGDPYGTDIPFHADGKLYVGRIERHYHPPGGAARPWGEHPGVSVFEVIDQGGGAGGASAGGAGGASAGGAGGASAGGAGAATDALEPVRKGWLVLRRGSRGAAVREVQRRLDALGSPLGSPLAADGVFGPRTEFAVRRFQARAAIVSDGVVGRQTVTALDRAAAGSP